MRYWPLRAADAAPRGSAPGYPRFLWVVATPETGAPLVGPVRGRWVGDWFRGSGFLNASEIVAAPGKLDELFPPAIRAQILSLAKETSPTAR